MSLHKTWNVRDQTDKALEKELERQYKNIDAEYKALKRVTDIEEAKKMLEIIWNRKKWANAIQTEQLRRLYNGAQNANE